MGSFLASLAVLAIGKKISFSAHTHTLTHTGVKTDFLPKYSLDFYVWKKVFSMWTLCKSSSRKTSRLDKKKLVK